MKKVQARRPESRNANAAKDLTYPQISMQRLSLSLVLLLSARTMPQVELKFKHHQSRSQIYSRPICFFKKPNGSTQQVQHRLREIQPD